VEGPEPLHPLGETLHALYELNLKNERGHLWRLEMNLRSFSPSPLPREFAVGMPQLVAEHRQHVESLEDRLLVAPARVFSCSRRDGMVTVTVWLLSEFVIFSWAQWCWEAYMVVLSSTLHSQGFGHTEQHT
jgi:hypothetical protein